ncbi:MAG: ferrochelatase [Actinomycetota bacterium]|nr:ferrochelatase [Actinomycetota bacterium]
MTTGVVVMAYGTPSDPDDVERFYLDVRRGRPPSPEQLADLKRRYDAIGGTSPLNARTAAQVAALQRALEVLEPGGYLVAYGAKHSAPKIEAAVTELAGRGVREVVGVVLAPHYSRLSVGEYLERAGERCAELGLTCGFVRHWHDEEALIAALAGRVREAAAALAPARGEIEYCFTAHSLPERILAEGDPYPDELAETARLVAARLRLPHYRIGWQSAGRTPEPWIGPDILVMLRELAAQGVGGVVVCSAGFTADHLEVLYDLDIEAAQLAAALGLAFSRTASLNDDPAVFAGLAKRVAAARPASAR